MQKKPLILIICGAIAILAVILLIVYIARGGSTDIKDITSKKEDETKVAVPEIILSSYPEEETEGSVEISIDAKIEGEENEIVSITTPDGKTTGYSSGKTFKVDDNGEYVFTVTASNGQSATKSITIDNISKISADNPYIPEGFEHVEGTEVDTGFVIEYKDGNQYVWVPVESGSPIREAPSDSYLEDDYTASGLTNSVAKYYGFYIAKYEASKGSVAGMNVAKSVSGEIPWASMDYEVAYDSARNTAVAYNYIGVKTALMNSYAWDTTLNWLNQSVTNYSSSRTYGNYSNQILETGATETDIVNGIADMSGNLREWTTEIYDQEYIPSDGENEVKPDDTTEEDEEEKIEYRVVRGGSATMDKIASSRIGEPVYLQDNYWGFRTVLYKE